MDVVALSLIGALLLMHYAGVTETILDNTSDSGSSIFNALVILFIAIGWAAAFFAVVYMLSALESFLHLIA
jgi:hypothetical protein